MDQASFTRGVGALFLALALSFVFATPAASGNQTFRFIDSLNRAHAVDLPASLEPRNVDQLRLYLDSNLVLDTMSYPDFLSLDPAGRGRMKYGRRLHFALLNADRHYLGNRNPGDGLLSSGRTGAWGGSVGLDSLKSWVRGDTLLQVRLIKAEESRLSRTRWAVGIAGAGVAASYLMVTLGMETRCVDGPYGTECTDTGLSRRNGMLAAGFLVTGLGAGALHFFNEFDEEKLARKLLARYRR